ncbi:uncharacterized protein [Chelonus insularis]|uniref:uncharacterized protein n=1 Tax=Chelonus insularis TaxID=460826 RepID=UPI00158BCA5E|nr:uncharacterized protein LOC118063757 [Chelonus insularis]
MNIDGDPEDGEWSEWGPWTCGASCNGGVGSRKRVCNNPEPNIKGEPCLGPSIMTGRCNTIACGDITEDTVSLIRRRKRTNFTAIVVRENQPTLIVPDADVVARIGEESPNSDIQWSHDGIIIKEKDDRVFIQNYTIEIKQTRVQDSGIYAISVRRVDGTHLILKVISLAVQPSQTKLTIRETMPMTIICRCVILGYVYKNLKITWLINKKTYKNYGISVPITVNVDTVLAINQSHNGLWECQVKEDDLRFIWTTNAILVNVISAPNWRTYLMEDEFTKLFFGWMPNETFVAVSVVLMFIIIISTISLSLYYYLKFQDRLKGGMSAYLKQKKLNKKIAKPETTQWQNNLRQLIRRFSPSLKLNGKIKKKKTKAEEEVELLVFDNADENT